MTRPASLLLLLAPGVLFAAGLSIPLGQQGDQTPLPERGWSQVQVLERFGLPDEEHPAVGRPPIARWDYRQFSVYFENGAVLDSVIHHQPRRLPAEEFP